MTPDEYQEWIKHPLTQKALKKVNEEYNIYVENLAKGSITAGTVMETGGSYLQYVGYLKGLSFLTIRLPGIVKQGGSNE